MKSQKGFTLIELLVVIAIIGILSSVVLISLQGARSRGEDTAIQQNLNTVRVQAELYYDSHDYKYTEAMFADESISVALENAKKYSGDANATVSEADDTHWIVAVPLKSDSTKYWCLDSGGISKQVVETEINTTDFKCE